MTKKNLAPHVCEALNVKSLLKRGFPFGGSRGLLCILTLLRAQARARSNWRPPSLYSSSRAILNVEPSTTHRLRDTNAAGGGGNGGPTRRQSLCAMGASTDILSALLWIFFDGPASVFIFPLHH